MVTATFRFHDELDDFLPPARRRREFAVPCARDATTKHMIEALGVPHTEVGTLRVNDAPAGLDQPLREGDRVVVHPQRTAMTGDTRFVADAHLGGLARLLRMAGFDTLYRNDFQDRELAALSGPEGRILLTRDRALLMLRAVARGCYLHALRPDAQFRELVRRLGLAAAAHPFTLCLECNLPPRPVAKEAVLHRLPPTVRDRHASFTTCAACGRVYWRGTHWERMRSLLARALEGGESL